MTTSQSLNLYHIALRYFKNEADASALVTEIEGVVDRKFENKREVLATKEDLANATGTLRKEIAESKTDMIKWMVGFWIVQMAVIIGLYLRN